MKSWGGGVRYMPNDIPEGIPLVGPLAYHIDIPTDRAKALPHLPPGPLADLLEAEAKRKRGEPFDVLKLYEKSSKADRFFPLVARYALMEAIGRGDERFFNRIRGDMARYPVLYRHPFASTAMDVLEIMIRLRLRMRDGYPEWLLIANFKHFPDAWRPYLSFLTVKALMESHQYERAITAIGLVGAMNESLYRIAEVSVWLKLFYAVASRETQHLEIMQEYFEDAVTDAQRYGIFTPFLEYQIGVGSLLDNALVEHAGDIRKRVNAQVDGFFYNTIRMRNHVMDEHLTERLSRREFYIARHLNDGFSYKQIADMLNLSIGYLRNLVSEVYTKLGINSRNELVGYVW